MIVHNQYVVDALTKLGIKTIDEKGKTRLELLEKIDTGVVILTAHGTSQEGKDTAKAKGLIVVDATCLDVTKTEVAIYNEDINEAEKNIKFLTDEWDKLQNHLMMFNDHKDINEMSKALKTLTAFSEYEKYDEMYVSLENFKLLFKYAVESSKPTLANIL